MWAQIVNWWNGLWAKPEPKHDVVEKPSPDPEKPVVEPTPAIPPKKIPENIVPPVSTAFADNIATYRAKWLAADIPTSKVTQVKNAAKIAYDNRARYQAIAQHFGNMPWWFIAGLHLRENYFNFKGVLHNGELIVGTGKKTTLVPAGRGPFKTFEEAAIDALGLKYTAKTDWTLEYALWRSEAFNGWGYRSGSGAATIPSRTSPYVWAATDEYKSGKYYADHKFSSTVVDQQTGVAAFYKGLVLYYGVDIK